MKNERLNELILKAKGVRTQNEFALHCGISSSAISRIMNGEYVATPETLKKIASRAHNGVTFNQLMVAAGHISEDDIKEEIIPNRNKNNYWLGKEEKSLQDYPEGFMSFEDYSKSPISDLDPIIKKLHLSEIAELSPEKQELFFAIVENAIKGLKK